MDEILWNKKNSQLDIREFIQFVQRCEVVHYQYTHANSHM